MGVPVHPSPAAFMQVPTDSLRATWELHPSELIRGRSIVEVAEDLQLGRISPDELPISYFVYEGQRIAVNNRGLAALRLAGMEPTIIQEVPAIPKLVSRLAEKPIDSAHRFPGTRIAVTGNKDGAGHLFTIFVP